MFPKRWVCAVEQWSVLTWWSLYFWIVRLFFVCFNECNYIPVCVRRSKLMKSSLGWWMVQGTCQLHQHGPVTVDGACFIWFASLIGVWSKKQQGESLPAVRSERRRLFWAAQLCFAFLVLRKEGLEQAKIAHICLLNFTRAWWSHLAVAEEETEVKEQESIGQNLSV